MLNIKKQAVGYMQQVWHAMQGVSLEQLDLATYLIRRANRVFLCGNGGSASLADHMAVDLQLAGISAVALTNVAAITTYANDYSYGAALMNQLNAMRPQPGDVLIVISTSGNSANVLAAAAAASALGMFTIAMTGKDGGLLARRDHITCQLHVPGQHTGVVQDVQQSLLHIIAYGLMGEKEK